MVRKAALILPLSLVACSAPQHFNLTHCDGDLNQNFECAKKASNGGVVTVRLNDENKTAMIDVVDSYSGKHLILDHCAIVDDSHWECNDKGGSPTNKITYGENGDIFYHTDYDTSFNYAYSESAQRFTWLGELMRGFGDLA